MLLKVKKLRAALAGFDMRPGKGSHTLWKYRDLPGITISGNDGDDAQPYQLKDVRNALMKVEKTL